MREAVVRLITEIVGASAIRVNEPMSRHTTFRIGGNADVLVEPISVSQLGAVLKLLKQLNVPCYLMGNGSNLLVGDGGIRGVVVKIGASMSQCDVDESNCVYAQAGVKLAKLANTAMNNGLTGLEFASGIPGTLGGAIYMNAGAYGREMKDVVSEVFYLDENGTLKIEQGFRCQFAYRSSMFSNTDKVIVSCKMFLREDNRADIRARMDELSARRSEKQPLNLPSAGSTFKRPEGYYAGKLIEDAGLKGYCIGGAAVSEKHSGFVVNQGGATAADVRDLIAHIQKTVMGKFGVQLQPEVKMVGEF